MRRRSGLRRVSEQGHRLGRLVSDLLASSQVDSGGLVVRSRFLDLNDVVADVVRGVDPEIAVSTNSRTLVLADRDHVEQMLVNYLSNAGKYGRPPLHVAVSNDDGYAVVRVSDAGDGVEEDFVPKLFDRFSRAPSAATNRIAGTGLGLSIVRDLARAQRGDAWYEPNEPQGACFCIKLPLATHGETAQ